MNIKEAHKLSFKNKHLLKDDISCFFCFRYHKVTDIEEWCDKRQTALCPHCGIDAILPGRMDSEFLIAMHKHWFTISNEED